MLNVEQPESGSTLESMCRKLWPTYRTSKSLRIKSIEYLRLLQQVTSWEDPFKKSKGPTDHWVQHHDHDFGYFGPVQEHHDIMSRSSVPQALVDVWQRAEISSRTLHLLAEVKKAWHTLLEVQLWGSDDSFLSCAEAISTTDNGQHPVAKSVKSVRIQSATFWSFTQHHNMLKSELKYKQDFPYLRPRGKGRKLAWHEDTMMLKMWMLPNLLPAATCRRCPQGGDWATAKLFVNQPAGQGGGGVVKY